MMRMRQGPAAQWIVPALLLLILLGLVANIVVLHKVITMTETPAIHHARQGVLTCEAIPVRLVREDPACANKLLETMNITNLQFLPEGSPLPGAAQNLSSWPALAKR